MAETRRMTVTEALRELKLYDAKIRKELLNCYFVGAAKNSSDLIGSEKKEDYIARAKSSYQSVKDLIANRNAVKKAVVQSNAVTNVTIGGVIYTVAEAIERKNSIEYEKLLLENMKKQFVSCNNSVEMMNMKVEAKVDKMIESFLSSDSAKKTDNELSALITPYKERESWGLVDPLDIKSKIAELENEIDVFEANCDVQLSLSNSITYIEV